jgi:hypothetical protein
MHLVEVVSTSSPASNAAYEYDEYSVEGNEQVCVRMSRVNVRREGLRDWQ